MPASVRKVNEQPSVSQRTKIIDFEEVRRYKNIEKVSGNNIELQYLVEIYKTLQEIANSNDKVMSEKNYQKRIIDLERENEKMRKKLKNSFPVHIMTYLMICSLVIGISATVLVLRFCFGIYIIDPYYIICALLISITLLMTAIIAIKDWKDYITDGKK